MAVVGRVAELRRYPVKSMLGESIGQSEFSQRGLAGDRAYALIDSETGKLVSAKRPRLWGHMFQLSASYDNPPILGASPSPVIITFPDGSCLPSDDSDVDRKLSEVLGRKVSLVSKTDDTAILDEVWIKEKQAEPYGPVVGSEGADRLIELPASLGSPPGTFFDYAPIHLVTTATIRTLAKAYPAGAFDVPRFRPNVVVEVPDEGFLENEWLGRALRLGDTVAIELNLPTPRCVMTTLPQGDLPKDAGILRTAAQVNPRDFGPFQGQPCVGVYADVVTGGAVRVGDDVRLE